MALFLIVGCATLQNWIGQPQLQTYTFIYDGGEYSALLPKDVPLPPENAVQKPHWLPCFGLLTIMHVAYEEPGECPIVSFWFTQKLGVVATVYHIEVDGQLQHNYYIYFRGLPVEVDKEEINKKLRAWSKGPKH